MLGKLNKDELRQSMDLKVGITIDATPAARNLNEDELQQSMSHKSNYETSIKLIFLVIDSLRSPQGR